MPHAFVLLAVVPGIQPDYRIFDRYVKTANSVVLDYGVTIEVIMYCTVLYCTVLYCTVTQTYYDSCIQMYFKSFLDLTLLPNERG